MKNTDFDAIVVGARCAGAPTAMLLARQGHRVLVVDRASFPSDTLSTHYIWQRGLARAAGWGLLPRLRTCGAPAIYTIRSMGSVRLEGVPPAVGGVTEARSIRRTALDKVLVDAAVEAGVVVQDGFVVNGLIAGDHGAGGISGYSWSRGDQQITAPIVIGADGMRSSVARMVGAETYRVVDSLTFCYYSYWSGTGLSDTIHHASDGRLVLAFPTNDDLTLVSVTGHRGAFGDFRADVEGSFESAVAHVPELAERLAAGRREERFFGTADLPNFYRQSSGAGWALVGDAAFHRDPVTGQGIGDAFDDAEAVAQAVHQGLAGTEPMESALARCQAERDIRTRSVWEYALKIASLAADSPTAEAYKRAAGRDPDEVARMLGVYGGAIPHWEVFTPDNFKRVLAGARGKGTVADGKQLVDGAASSCATR